MTAAPPGFPEPVHRGLLTVDAIQPLLTDASRHAEIDELTISGRLARLGDADAAALLALHAGGHVVEVRVGDAAWSLAVRADSPARPAMVADGRAELALAAGRADELERALARDDVSAALAAVADLPAQVSVRLRNDAAATGAHWVDSERSLTALLKSPTWIAAARALGDGPRVLVVGDWLGEHLITDGLRIVGPQALLPRAEATRGAPESLVTPSSADGRVRLPSPAIFAGAEGNAPADRPDGGVRGLLHGLARCLSWYWLANDVELETGGSVVATVTGARSVVLRLKPSPVADSTPDVALFGWAFAGSDPGRLEAARQAASLALVTGRDLPTAARPALRTARSLYELSRRGAVGEALAARRAARDAALGAARQAAAAARQASGKAIERVVLQIGALAAVVSARASDLVESGLAVVLAVVIAVLTAVAWVVTAWIELPSATGGLEAEIADLGQYRDTLSEDDINAIRHLDAGEAAKKDLRRSAQAVRAVYGLALAASLAAAAIMAVGLVGGTGEIGKTRP